MMVVAALRKTGSAQSDYALSHRHSSQEADISRERVSRDKAINKVGELHDLVILTGPAL